MLRVNISNPFIFVFLSILDKKRIKVSHLNDELPAPSSITSSKLENTGFSAKARLSKVVNMMYACSRVYQRSESGPVSASHVLLPVSFGP